MRFDWKAGLGIVLSAVLLWWTLHDIDFAAVWGVLERSNGWLWLAATVAATMIFPVRARRWRTILDPVVLHLPFAPLWRATAIGMMVNNVAPARAGEIARVVTLVRERPDVPFGGALAALAVDRVFDLILILLLLFVAPLDPAFPAGTRLWGRSVPALALGTAGLTVAVLGGLYAVVIAPDAFARGLSRVMRRVAPRWEARSARAVRTFAEGLGVLRDPRRFAAVFAWSLVHWLLCAWSLWIGFRAVGIAAPFSAALFVNSLQSVASAIPASPGFFGLFESVSRVGLAVYGVPATLAVSWALGYHVLTFVPITVFGFVHLAQLGLTLRQVAGGSSGGGA